MGVKVDTQIAQEVFGLEVIRNKASRKSRPLTTAMKRKGVHTAELAPYSTNELYAFEALKKLNWGFYIHSPMGNKRRGPQMVAPDLAGKFFVHLSKVWEIGNGRTKQEAVAAGDNNLAMAICKAILKATKFTKAGRVL